MQLPSEKTTPPTDQTKDSFIHCGFQHSPPEQEFQKLNAKIPLQLGNSDFSSYICTMV